MPFQRPTPFELHERLAAEIQAAFPGADARLRRSVEAMLVRVLALASHDLHGHLDWAARQLLPDTAESEFLERHAGFRAIFRRPAAPARGPILLTGVSGSTVPAGTELRRADDARYTLDGTVVLGPSGGNGLATAVVGGEGGNALAGQALTAIAPVPGLTGVTVGAGGLTGGLDIEDDAALLERLLQRLRNPPSGGNDADYEGWALAVPGVARAFVYPNHVGRGTVGVAVLAPGGTLPSAGLVAEVQAAIQTLRPVTAEVTVFAPATVAVPVTLTISPDTSEMRSAVSAALAAFFAAEAAPGATLHRSRLSEAISAVDGELWHGLTAPAADVVPPAFTLPVLGAVTFA